MTTRFRLDAVTTHTVQGDVTYRFPSPLTVLAGPVGVGKSTLFELIKYGLGSNSQLAQVARTSVLDIELQITVGQSRLALRRSLDPSRRQFVQVANIATQERLPDHLVDSNEPLLSTLLLKLLGLPTDVRAASRTKNTTNPGARISFADILTFMYIRQADINRDIASSQEYAREPKRKAVFELLFGLTDAEILRLRSSLATRNAELEQAVRDHTVVVQFLRDSETANRDKALSDYEQAKRDENVAVSAMRSLREAVDPVTDRETQTLRDLLGEAERSLADARNVAAQLAQQQSEYSKERRRVVHEFERLRRLQDANGRLATIEFMVCPRCLQDVTHRETADGQCRLCLQPDPVVPNATPQQDDSYEQRQLADQLTEMDELLLTIANQLAATQDSIAHRQTLVRKLSDDLDSRTRQRITPQLQAFSDATRLLTQAQAKQRELDGVLRQWDRANDLALAAQRLQDDMQHLRSDLEDAEDELKDRKRELLDELDAEFAAAVADIGIPGVQTTQIHRTNYLPVLNGQPFTMLSPAGGVRTATQAAYWISLITVALRRRDTYYPAFLLIDSPRTSLNNNDQLVS